MKRVVVVLGLLFAAAGVQAQSLDTIHMIIKAAEPSALVVVQGGSHTVDVSWGQSPDGASVAYNVYRATSTCTGSPSFSKISSTAAGVLSFVDNTVVVGNTYCYEVTGVLNGLEGGPSNSAQAVLVPSPPPNVTTKVN